MGEGPTCSHPKWTGVCPRYNLSGETRVSEVSGGLSAAGQRGVTDHRPMHLGACCWGVVEGVFVSRLNLVYISVCV